MKFTRGSTAVITGATSGIGLEFAQCLAHRGMNLVLVARDSQRLAQISGKLVQEFAVSVESMRADLTVREDVDILCARVRQADVQILVNNAGFGLHESFVTSDIEREQQLLDVLVTAVLRVSHAALPGLLDRGVGGILNVSSVAGWMTSGTYSAAKSWVTTFSESLHRQVSGTGVNVLAVCPGFTRTEFQSRAGMSTATIPKWMWLDTKIVVETALQDFAKGRAISVAGKRYKILALVARHLPRSALRKLSTMSRANR